MVLFLDLTEDQARERGGWGDEIYEKAEMQRRVRELFWGLSMGTLGTGDGPLLAQEHTRLAYLMVAGLADVKPFRQEEEDLVLIDASPSVEEVAEEIWSKVRYRVEAVERGEMGRAVRTVS
jgi:dTMP kinase